MATVSLTWKDFNLNEDGFNIYRSETPMDVNNMPAPIATVGHNVGSYDDTTGIVGTGYYYRVGAVRGTEEKISPEIFRVFDNTTNTHDVFGDGSAVATYNFDGDATDLGGENTLTESAEVSYAEGLIGDALQPLSGQFIKGDSNTFELGTSSWTFSFWAKLNPFNDISTSNSAAVRFFSKAYFGSSSTRYSFGVDEKGALTLLLDGGDRGDNTSTTDGIMVLNEWKHVVLVIERDVNSRAYVDSTLVSDELSTLPSTTDRKNNYEFGIGCYNNSSGNISGSAGVLDGLLDQFRIFNRALTQEEIDILYQEGTQFL